MIKAEIQSNINFPKEFLIQDDLLRIANQIIVPLMQAGIDRNTQIDGGPFPQNEPQTIKRKGHGRVLIEEGKLRRSFWAKKSGKNAVVVTLEKDRLDIGKYLQVDGIGSKSGKKYYKFFGITDGMEKDANKYMETKIKEVCDKFNGK